MPPDMGRAPMRVKDTVLVIGIHRAELGFGDRVAALIDPAYFDVMRIAHGIEQPRTGPNERFLSRTRHREIYLQLWQQVTGRYRVLIDLHCGFDEMGASADVFSQDGAFLDRLAAALRVRPPPFETRPVRIVAEDSGRTNRSASSTLAARTWIPQRVWQSCGPFYAGIEVYLAKTNEGCQAEWTFAASVIEQTRRCALAPAEKTGALTADELEMPGRFF